MTGQYEIEVYNNRVHYSLTIRRNITIIQGDSATGKTALINLISQYEANGASSGITLICEKSCVNLSGSNWQAYLSTLHDCIVFVDEGAPFIRSREFASAIKGSDNYYVLIYRDALPELPYSIEEIYGLQTVRPSQKYVTAKRVYNEMVHLYNSAPNQAIRPTTVVTEGNGPHNQQLNVT